MCFTGRAEKATQLWTHCNILQHTSPHDLDIGGKGTTVEHTATHCNTLQHTATHCNTLQHTATHYTHYTSLWELNIWETQTYEKPKYKHHRDGGVELRPSSRDHPGSRPLNFETIQFRDHPISRPSNFETIQFRDHPLSRPSSRDHPVSRPSSQMTSSLPRKPGTAEAQQEDGAAGVGDSEGPWDTVLSPDRQLPRAWCI